jgi:hypothetical protein
MESPENTRYLVRRQRLIPLTNIRGETTYYWRNWIPMPRRLNWLWRRLAGR